MDIYHKEDNAAEIFTDLDRIYNADETAVQLCPKIGKLLCPSLSSDLVIVKYEKEYFPRILIKGINADIKVKKLEMVRKADQIWSHYTNMLQKIESTQLTCRIGNTYDLPEIKIYM